MQNEWVEDDWKQLKTPGARLKWAREQAGYDTANAAARAIGVNKTSYAMHENTTRGLPRAASRYADFYHINLDWLVAGKGAPYRPGFGPKKSVINLERNSLLRTGHKGSDKRLAIQPGRLVRSFDPDAPRAHVSEFGSVGVPDGEIPQVIQGFGMGDRSDEPTIQIPVGDQAVQAMPVVATWKVPERVLRPRLSGPLKNVHIIECEGDSMEPRIHSGDLVFIDTSRRSPTPPGIFAIHDGLNQRLTRLEVVVNSDPTRIKVIPENPRHPSYEFPLEEMQIVGRYLGRFTLD